MRTTVRDEVPMWDLELVAPGVHRVLPAPQTGELESMLEAVAAMGSSTEVGRCADIARVDQLGLLERLKGAAAAAQARLTAAFEASQLQQQDVEVARAERTAAEAEDPGEAGAARQRARRLRRERGRGVGDQVALARRLPTSQGGRLSGFARAMGEMPHTHGLLSAGWISEWAATILVRESAVLTLEDRRRFDEQLCAMRIDLESGIVSDPRVLDLSTTALAGVGRAAADRLDPEAAVRRRERSEQQRRVTIRPTPEAMVHLTGLLPVTGGVGAFASLQAEAKTLKAAGDERSVSQIMADVMVARLTGVASGVVPCEVGLVMDPATLAGADEVPARTRDGKITIPAQVAREWAEHPDAPTWLRRVWTDPATGQVTDVDTERRAHDAPSARFVAYRDQTCRHPGCEGPIQAVDHVVRHADGGPTTRANAQGLCEGHNLVKEMPGWRTRVSDPRPGRHEVETTTPTGHVYRSKAPPAHGPPGIE